MVTKNVKRVKDYVTKTKLESLDFVINPYVGCPNKCLYCYASYMRTFSKHDEPWGDFIDIKRTNKRINVAKLKHQKVMISTVTDPYNKIEEETKLTRSLLEQLVRSDAYISVVTKSKLVTRDIDLFKKMKHLEVAISFCTHDEKLKSILEPCSDSLQERLETLKILHENGIKTVVFISPIMPEITDYKKIIKMTKRYTDEYWFDKLSLRIDFKTRVLDFIDAYYPKLKPLYKEIYCSKTLDYFDDLSKEIDDYCNKNNIRYTNMIAGT